MKRIIICTLLLAACSTSEPAEKSEPAPKTATTASAEKSADTAGPGPISDYPSMTTDDGSEVLEPPFTAAELRQATPDGLIHFIKMRRGGDRYLVQITFEDPDDEGVTLINVPIDGEGKQLAEPTSERVTWKKLESHAYFPAEETAVERTSVKTELGAMDALLFTYTTERAGQTVVTRTWFATELPGAPVRLEQEMGDQIVMTMELVGRSDPTQTEQ